MERRWAGRVASKDLDFVDGVQWEFQPYRLILIAADQLDLLRVDVVQVDVVQFDVMEVDVLRVDMVKIVLLLLR